MNIKKILHIGPNKNNKGRDAVDNASVSDKSEIKHKVVTEKVELSKEEVAGSKQRQREIASSNGKPSDHQVPIATEDVSDSDVDCVKCEGCNKPMKYGNEIRLTNGLSWHYKCFRCDNCAQDVSQQKYAYERGCLLCEPCIKKRVRTNCHKCVMVIEMEDTKLIVDGKEFHEACFCCTICAIRLKDVYGSKDGDYYCETCYVDKFGKRCFHCSKVILGAGLRFGEANYHKECFLCTQCGGYLEQGSVHAIKERPVCPVCYEQQFKESCFECKQTVSEGLKFREQRFHVECFKCRNCGVPLADKKGEFLLKEEGLECKQCVRVTMKEDIEESKVMDNCNFCQLPIHVKNLVFDGENNWHYKCFCCSLCNSALVNQKYYDKEGKLYCNNCFLAEFLPTCFACKIELSGSRGVKMNSPSGQVLTWHEDCLQCCKCQAALNTENVVFNEKLFCKSCYVDTMLNKCDACVKPITGVGFTFRGRFWHDTCFACDICQTVFDEGKFRNLREQKFCDTCFKNSTRAV